MRQIAEQPSPSSVLLSSQRSSPSWVPLPHVAGGASPWFPLFLTGSGTAVTKSLALSSVSSQESSSTNVRQMSSRLRAA